MKLTHVYKMIQRLSLALFFLINLLSASATTETDKIMERIRYWNVYTPADSLIRDYMDDMNEDGGYSDIDYSVTSRTGWEPGLHISRLLPMAYAYISPNSSFYSNKVLYQKIAKGIDFWIASNPKSNNWYHTQVSEPLSFGLILIAMREGNKKLSSEIERKVIDRWRNNGSHPANRGGSNTSEIGLHWMYFACLTEDEELLDTALYYIFKPIEFTDYQGFQVDYSFFQHGCQLYIGGYGETILESVLQTAVCVKETKFGLSEDKKDLLRHYVLFSYSNVIRGDVINWNCLGRQLSRVDYLRDSQRRVAIIDKMIEVDPPYEEEYRTIRNRLLGVILPSDGVNPYHTHYYRGDYTVHVRPDYSFSTRMLSTRTCRQEKGNGENLLGYYLSDGATDIACSGNEYTNIMPLWDWNKIPGVTAPLLDSIPKTPELWQVYGTSDFAGGVSDSIYGCSAYRYYDEYSGVNTGACKGYFFFDDEVVCLGAGIRSDHHAVTTVNQCWGGQEFVCGSNNGNIVKFDGETEETSLVGAQWVLHDDIGYYFPVNQKVRAKNKETKGNWRWISTVQEDKEISGRVFTLCLDHEVPVENTTYSYIVRPNSSITVMNDYAEHCPIEILANTDSVQIVRHSKLNLTECIFYRGCKYSGSDMTIQSSSPCAVILKRREKDYLVHIADPTQSRQTISVGIGTHSSGDMVFSDCDFADLDEQYAGMTKVLSINMSSSTNIKETENSKVEYHLLKSPYRLCFNKPYHGRYRLLSLEGMELKRGAIEGNQLRLDIRQRGIFLVDMIFDNNSHATVKLIAD